ncbi:menaquinone biosynthetic enzyme MqnA/MqnD family protein [Silvibacterium sp.]|uniref:menaquinone biosynthetic enzyme MqnA/MqnD family protein n=1 Tax=Silvibacterium sp. TaxID=1964179 RepID=UPI0039E36D33
MNPVSRKLILAAIDFVNPAPLMWDFEHEPRKSELAGRYEIVSSTPAECARRLKSGEADIGLVPVASYALTSRNGAESQSIVPGCAIASLDEIRSLLLVLRPGLRPEDAKTVALDTASMTTVTYTRILFAKYWRQQPEFLPMAADLETMLASADAAVVIGDPALLALEARAAREQRTGERLTYLDLAHVWKQWTGTPWISAFWAVRDAAFGPDTVTREQLAEDFLRSRDAGMTHVEELVQEWAGKIAVPEPVLREYLSRNIHYILDEACLEGLRLFYRYAAECGALPHVPELKFL